MDSLGSKRGFGTGAALCVLDELDTWTGMDALGLNRGFGTWAALSLLDQLDAPCIWILPDLGSAVRIRSLGAWPPRRWYAQEPLEVQMGYQVFGHLYCFGCLVLLNAGVAAYAFNQVHYLGRNRCGWGMRKRF
jgi:hypothetical protein